MSTLEKVRKKVRRLTATPSALQLPDSEIDEYIDTFYTQDMPAHLKLWNLHDTYEFYTQQHEDRYTLPVNTYLGISPPVYIAGYQSMYTQHREQFYRIYPKLDYSEVVATGDGTAGPYLNITLTNTPVLKRDFYVSAVDSNNVTRTLIDLPQTDITGILYLSTDTASPPTSRGTINYVSGAVTITDFGDTIDSGTDITAQYVPYEPSRPTAMLFYDNTMYLRPVPDKAYKVVIEAYRTPSMLLDVATDEPDVQQWWQYIAFGAAYKILEDRQDTETMQALAARLDEQKQLVLHRTILQQTPQRTETIYSQQSNNYFGTDYRGGF